MSPRRARFTGACSGRFAAALILMTAFLVGTGGPAYADAIGAAKALAAPGVPGANHWSCKPPAAHPRPVVLVHGTFASGSVNWRVAARALAARKYCVFVLTYGEMPGVPVLRAIAPVADSAAQLSVFVKGVLAATRAAKVDIIGHSQGGMMPRYYMRFLGGAAKVHTLVGIAPSNHGTTAGSIRKLADPRELQQEQRQQEQQDPQQQQQQQQQELQRRRDAFDFGCPACTDQVVGSALLTKLNAGGDTLPGVHYLVISTKYDEVVTPYTSQALRGRHARNVVLQKLCRRDLSEHAAIVFDPIALHEAMNALDPAHATRTTCRSRL